MCEGMIPHGVTEEHINLKAFPFSLKEDAKDWLYFLPLGFVTTWKEMQSQFLGKFFLASRAARIKKEIYRISQTMGEPFEY